MKKQKGFFEIYDELQLQAINNLIHKLTKKRESKRWLKYREYLL